MAARATWQLTFCEFPMHPNPHASSVSVGNSMLDDGYYFSRYGETVSINIS